MPWNAVFPTGPTLISQSVTPIQNNWAFLAANIGTDHYFNTGAPNEGHHQFVNYVNQNPNPAAAVSGINFTRSTGIAASIPSWPSFRNANYTYKHVLGETRQFVAGGGGYPKTVSLFTFTANVDGPVAGTFFVYENGFSTLSACINYVWDGTVLTPLQGTFAQNGNQITALGLITPLNTTIMEATLAGAATYNWCFTAMPFAPFGG